MEEKISRPEETYGGQRMNYRRITEYINKYGYDFVIKALEDAEDRANFSRDNGASVIKRKQNTARIVGLCKELGVRIKDV